MSSRGPLYVRALADDSAEHSLAGIENAREKSAEQARILRSDRSLTPAGIAPRYAEHALAEHRTCEPSGKGESDPICVTSQTAKGWGDFA